MAATHHRRAVSCLIVALSCPGSSPAQTPATPEATPRTFEIVATKYKFAPSVIEVTEGDQVVLKMRSADSTHGLGIKDFKVKKRIPKTGETVEVSFVADKVGTFKIICSEYCGGGHSGMKGSLIVHAKAK
jgi:cytochrome c oxidase subunit 2